MVPAPAMRDLAFLTQTNPSHWDTGTARTCLGTLGRGFSPQGQICQDYNSAPDYTSHRRATWDQGRAHSTGGHAPDGNLQQSNGVGQEKAWHCRSQHSTHSSVCHICHFLPHECPSTSSRRFAVEAAVPILWPVLRKTRTWPWYHNCPSQHMARPWQTARGFG